MMLETHVWFAVLSIRRYFTPRYLISRGSFTLDVLDVLHACGMALACLFVASFATSANLLDRHR